MIESERLLRYFFADLAADEERVVEEHVLGCDACGATIDRWTGLRQSIEALIGDAEIPFPVTPLLVAKLGSLITRRYALRPGETVACMVTAADRFTLTTLTADLRDVTRVDFEVGGHLIEDIAFDRHAGEVNFVATGETLRRMPTMQLHLRLLTGDRVLGAYVLDHTGYGE